MCSIRLMQQTHKTLSAMSHFMTLYDTFIVSLLQHFIPLRPLENRLFRYTGKTLNKKITAIKKYSPLSETSLSCRYYKHLHTLIKKPGILCRALLTFKQSDLEVALDTNVRTSCSDRVNYFRVQFWGKG